MELCLSPLEESDTEWDAEKWTENELVEKDFFEDGWKVPSVSEQHHLEFEHVVDENSEGRVDDSCIENELEPFGIVFRFSTNDKLCNFRDQSPGDKT